MFEIGKLNSELWQAIENLRPSMTDETFEQVRDLHLIAICAVSLPLGAWRTCEHFKLYLVSSSKQ